MERLTEPGGSRCEGCQDAEECAYIDGEFPSPCPDAARYERLKEYEDTGLEPEDLQSTVDIDYVRIMELLKSDKDGRLVVLPCRVGDTVYIARENRGILESRVRTLFWNKQGSGLIRTQHYDIPLENYGKTVFLTREEAEAVLAREDGEG